ncbi:hypothetical protein PTSG_03719 [Salpingoeca rosetta]|uniref:Methyltransferase type 12 domain-containing protein n=1 Tax=Salpingoeca rosetta (strain ATCC 50818 / BSB-021) TaxID=946362 RepID=F2U6E0_SALR5|nr:uncharacterized protein PTSG_03719 [Salpingoeca rosetta]EGD83081.1 hypothetical protein PTSG_03719 [Salpingoeca rosetta]|eukprot:XP_004995445.1 hypothetical protein PTSG_03719 [Salpingoeca rosetta]
MVEKNSASHVNGGKANGATAASSTATTASSSMRLGKGAVRRRRRTMGLHRSKNFLQRQRARLNSGSKREKALSLLQLLFYVGVDILTASVTATIWFFAGIFLWFFSHIHDAILSRIVGFHYLYNVSWEDPRVDREALNLTEDDHVITIASACDNVLDFIIDGARVTAVDLNECQLALCELKKAAILELGFEDFFAIFAEQDIKLLKAKFAHLKRHLGPHSLRFWERTLRRGFGGFMYSGSSGWLAFMLFRVLFPVIGMGWVRKALLDGVDQATFRRKAQQHAKRLEFIAWVADSVLVPICAPLAGVPAAQLGLGDHREGNVHTIMERVFLHTDVVNDNYFFLGYILGKYTRTCCPRYLKEEHFGKLKRYIRQNRLDLYHGTLADRYRDDMRQVVPPTYTAAIMLDHLDWMDDAGVNEELALLWPLLDDDRGRILWRSFSDTPHRAALKWMDSTRVDDGSRDRTGMYWGVWVAEKKTCGVHPEDITPGLFWSPQPPFSLVDQLLTGLRIVSFPVLQAFRSGMSKAQCLSGVAADDLSRNRHAHKIEAFYQSQAKAYDAFRENFLHARKALATSLPLKSDEKLVWIDVGAGTARNLEFFPVDTLRRRFAKIYILDISASLLNVARHRIERAGLSDIVELVLADFTDLSEAGQQALPKPGTAHLVTFSYSLSMIPNKTAALQQAARLLHPDGAIGVADFFQAGPAHHQHKPVSRMLSRLYDLGCKLWFRQDGVHLLSDHLFDTVLERDNGVLAVCTERFRGQVPLIPVLRPWHGVWVGKRAQDDAEEEDGDDEEQPSTSQE